MYRIIICAFFAACLIFTGCKTNKDTSRLTVASEMRDCYGVGLMKCFLVKTGGHNDWVFLYGGIEGFNYEPGYEYIIEVRQEEIPNPAADQSAYKYVFVKEVSKTKKTSEDMPSIPLVD